MAPKFRGTQFSQIAVFKHFVGTIFALQELIVSLHIFQENFTSLIFADGANP